MKKIIKVIQYIALAITIWFWAFGVASVNNAVGAYGFAIGIFSMVGMMKHLQDNGFKF